LFSENRLKKIKKNSSVLSQLKEKREECINNLLNASQTINTDKDFELESEIEAANKIISHLIPKQPQTVGEIAHLIKHDHLNQQKEEQEEEATEAEQDQKSCEN
jgi:peptidoglycan hydrolase CwlO-like protein